MGVGGGGVAEGDCGGFNIINLLDDNVVRNLHYTIQWNLTLRSPH